MKQNRDTQIGERAKATVAARAAADAAKRSRKNRTISSDSSTGGSDTVPATPERDEFRKELAKRNATPGMAKGGKMASCGMKKGGKAKAKPFAATKFGAAMKKKSADTKGRAMPKFAKGGSIDGCAVKGKTKTSMIKMKNGGSC